jgi:hypothetical protein
MRFYRTPAPVNIRDDILHRSILHGSDFPSYFSASINLIGKYFFVSPSEQERHNQTNSD